MDNRRALVLVIDAHTDVLQSIAAALDGAGYVCRCSTSAETAMESIRAAIPDVIICDSVVHDESGMEVCERLKADPALANIPVMFLSRLQTPDIIRRHDALGVSYYVRKPVDPAVLRELVDNVVSGHHFAHPLAEAPLALDAIAVQEVPAAGSC
jgi:CheY-like chemotaxis protein